MMNRLLDAQVTCTLAFCSWLLSIPLKKRRKTHKVQFFLFFFWRNKGAWLTDKEWRATEQGWDLQRYRKILERMMSVSEMDKPRRRVVTLINKTQIKAYRRVVAVMIRGRRKKKTQIWNEQTCKCLKENFGGTFFVKVLILLEHRIEELKMRGQIERQERRNKSTLNKKMRRSLEMPGEPLKIESWERNWQSHIPRILFFQFLPWNASPVAL